MMIKRINHFVVSDKSDNQIQICRIHQSTAQECSNEYCIHFNLIAGRVRSGIPTSTPGRRRPRRRRAGTNSSRMKDCGYWEFLPNFVIHEWRFQIVSTLTRVVAKSMSLCCVLDNQRTRLDKGKAASILSCTRILDLIMWFLFGRVTVFFGC